jgi:hypothetical protein
MSIEKFSKTHEQFSFLFKTVKSYKYIENLVKEMRWCAMWQKIYTDEFINNFFDNLLGAMKLYPVDVYELCQCIKEIFIKLCDTEEEDSSSYILRDSIIEIVVMGLRNSKSSHIMSYFLETFRLESLTKRLVLEWIDDIDNERDIFRMSKDHMCQIPSSIILSI